MHEKSGTRTLAPGVESASAPDVARDSKRRAKAPLLCQGLLRDAPSRRRRLSSSSRNNVGPPLIRSEAETDGSAAACEEAAEQPVEEEPSTLPDASQPVEGEDGVGDSDDGIANNEED